MITYNGKELQKLRRYSSGCGRRRGRGRSLGGRASAAPAAEQRTIVLAPALVLLARCGDLRTTKITHLTPLREHTEVGNTITRYEHLHEKTLITIAMTYRYDFIGGIEESSGPQAAQDGLAGDAVHLAGDGHCK